MYAASLLTVWLLSISLSSVSFVRQVNVCKDERGSKREKKTLESKTASFETKRIKSQFAVEDVHRLGCITSSLTMCFNLLHINTSYTSSINIGCCTIKFPSFVEELKFSIPFFILSIILCSCNLSFGRVSA